MNVSNECVLACKVVIESKQIAYSFSVRWVILRRGILIRDCQFHVPLLSMLSTYSFKKMKVTSKEKCLIMKYFSFSLTSDRR